MNALNTIREVLRREGISASQVSRSMGRNRSYVSILLNHNDTPNASVFIRILDACGYDVIARFSDYERTID